MPRLRNETIEAHRAAVRDAILDATAALVGEHGLSAVTMSQIAEAAGIGRATLYKYFPDVESILDAWHEREIAAHLAQLSEVRDQAARAGGAAAAQLEAVLEAFALISHEHIARPPREHGGGGGTGGGGHHHGARPGDAARGAGHHGTELGALLHRDRGEHVAKARQQLATFIRELLAQGAAEGDFRDDVAPGELAAFCLHALTAASSLPSRAAVRRLVAVTVSGLRRPN